MSAQGYYPTQVAMPINMAPGKNGYYAPQYQHPAYRNTSVSPPERPQSSTTSGLHSSVPSYSNSATSSSYAGSSSGEYDTPTSGVDLMDLLNDRMANAYDPMPMDHSLARQTQTSGALNAKQRELMELQALAQSRLASTKANFADGIRAAKEVKRDLDWTQKRVSGLKSKAERRYPAQYQTAQSHYPSPSDY